MVDSAALKATNAKRCVKLTHERLRQVLTYCTEKGIFTRRERTASAIAVGDVAGWVNPNGYRYIEVCGERFLAHRLAWFYMTGEWPAAEVDHRDCDRDNNSWANLRAASRVQNAANARLKPANTSGFKGVSFDKREGKYVARIRHNGRRISLGYYDNPDAAARAYAARAAEIHGEFARSA